MEDFINFLGGSGIADGFLNFYHSGFFAVLKFLIGIYVVVIFLDMILLIYNRGISSNLQSTLYGTALPSDLVTKAGKKRMREKWQKIEEMLESENESQYKLAIIEADNIIDGLMKRIGYKGDNMKEKLEESPEFDIEGKNDILEAHDIRNKVIHEENFRLDKKEAKEVLGKYKIFLEYYNIF